MASDKKIDINVGPSMYGFIDSIMKTVIESAAETGEYKGTGGHGLKNHGGHGPHTQISIGLGAKTFNIRKLEK